MAPLTVGRQSVGPQLADEFAAFVRRILRACSRRVGNNDIEALGLMLGLAEEIDTAIAEAVKDMRACGYS